jgi:hypothetical protein
MVEGEGYEMTGLTLRFYGGITDIPAQVGKIREIDLG